MSRKRKPSVLKLIEGTYQTNSAPKNEPVHSSDVDLSVPAELDEQGKGAAKWRELAPKLNKQGCLTDVDLQNLKIFCFAYENLLRAQEEIQNYGVTLKNDKGNTIANPAVAVMSTQSSIISKYSAMLGLDPASRSGIEGKAGGKQVKSFADLKKE